MTKNWLLNTRRLFLWGDIEELTAKRLVIGMRRLAFLSDEPIYIYIHTDGGEVDSANSIIDEMVGLQSCGIKIYTIAHGKAYSAGAYILAIGSPQCRFALPNASIMLHPVSCDVPTDYADIQEKQLAFVGEQTARIENYLLSRCNKNTPKKKKDFLEMLDSTVWLHPEAAIKLGIIDGLWDYKQERLIDEAAKTGC